MVRHRLTPGKHGRGLVINKGDSIAFPASLLQFSLDPIKSKGTLSGPSLESVAKQLFFPAPGKLEDFAEHALSIECELDKVIAKFEPVAGLDVNCADDIDELAQVMEKHKDTAEYWAWLAGYFSAMRRSATEDGDLAVAVWATAVSERARAMWAYKTGAETVVRMGHAARRLVTAIGVWNSQKENADEQFWQDEFMQQQFILSLAFGVPIVLLKDQAYVGGMDLSRQGANLVDYLFTVEGSRQAILVEIKTPKTQLMGKAKYRTGVYAPSRDLTGAVNQVLSYRTTLMRRLEEKRTSDGSTLGPQLPKCVVVAGNCGDEFADKQEVQDSFELYRGNLKDVEVIGYDELFRKVSQLSQIFALEVHDKKKGPTPPVESTA